MTKDGRYPQHFAMLRITRFCKQNRIALLRTNVVDDLSLKPDIRN